MGSIRYLPFFVDAEAPLVHFRLYSIAENGRLDKGKSQRLPGGGTGKLIFFRIVVEGALEAAVCGLCLAQRFMQVEVVLARVDDAAGDVGAMVGCALEIRQKVGEDKACLDAALALLHSQDMARAHLLFERVDDLLKRLDLGGDGDVALLKGLEREGEDLADGGGDGGEPGSP